ncbi:MAG: hypothetical protein HKP48_01850 [Winogradskyella sp.]|uniref:hypothetical protein n=1 Tax=Winogradskyella sp. TaxID=1883156 RepID=UPI0017EE266D|nr:hypothetical protein [Winogradskyella sp.]MBT8243745.1 hypothetical protein [Winogradskyella sp.]NNK22062.1 hypothetical protein [Winogradskyella sp.]
MKNFFQFFLISILFFSCDNSSDEIQNDTSSDFIKIEKISILNNTIDVINTKSTTRVINFGTSINFTDSQNFYSVNNETLITILQLANIDYNTSDIIKVDISAKTEYIKYIDDIFGVNIYYLDDNKIINHNFFKNNNNGFVNQTQLNGQLKDLKASISEKLFNYAVGDFEGNSFFYSFLTTQGYRINKILTGERLESLIYKNLDIRDVSFRNASIVERSNPTCGGRCDYGQDFEDCIETPNGGDDPVITDVKTAYCEDNGCICCVRILADKTTNQNRIVDLSNAYSFRDGFLQSNNFTRSYIDSYYMVSDIYCKENLYNWRQLDEYYYIYTTIDAVSKRIQDSSYNGEVLSSREASDLIVFIDNEIIRNNNYSMLVSIFNNIKNDINHFKNKSRSAVLNDILSRG